MKTATAKDVHEECDNQAKVLIKEANQLVNKSTTINNYLIKKIKEMGFVNSSSIKDKKEKIELANKVIRYSLLYPQNNFLTEEAIEKICKKYGLLFADAADFIGAIPLKNQIEMADFKLSDDDIIACVIDRNIFRDNVGRMKAINRKLKKAGFMEGCALLLLRMELKTKCEKRFTKKELSSLDVDKYSVRNYLKPKFKIISTSGNISLEGKQVIGEYKVVDKDPVVLCKVDGGYLQVSCWGDESSIEEFNTAYKN